MPLKKFFSDYLNGVSFRSKYFFSITAPVLAILVVTLLEFITVDLHNRTEKELNLHRAALKNSAQIIEVVLDLDTGLRGYLISGKDAYLSPFEAAQERVEGIFSEAKATARLLKNVQYQRIVDVERMYSRWMESVAQYSLRIKRDPDMELSEKQTLILQLFNTQRGKLLTDGIRLELANYNEEARLMLDQIEQKHEKLESYILWLTFISPAVIILMTALFAVRFMREVIRNHRVLMRSVEEIRSGNYGYQANLEGNNELTMLADAFNDMSKQIKRAMAEKEQAASVKSDFLANMSHEIRTPLNGVIGTIEMIDKETLNEEAKEKFSLITESSNILMRVINDILDISKMEAGRLDLDPQPMNLYRAANTVIKLAEGETRDKPITLELQYDSMLPHNVVADSTRLKQILINLVGNAVKFTEQGSVRLIISKQADQEANKCLVRFEVIDTGIGIDREKVGTLFQPFLQEDASITRKYGGTGLGLAICYNLVEVMSGSIFVESKKGKGTRIFFDVPLELTNEEEQEEGMDQSVEKGKFSGKTALVAEDNGINRIVAGAFLEDLGFEVSFALNGQEAIDQAAEKRFDVIFMDMQMPLVDGIQATRTILSNHSDAPPIIGLTANVMTEDLRMCIDAGMLSVITKPLSIVKLDEVLKSVQI